MTDFQFILLTLTSLIGLFFLVAAATSIVTKTADSRVRVAEARAREAEAKAGIPLHTATVDEETSA